MKRTFKHLLLLALALVLVAGLLPTVALNVRAASHPADDPCDYGDWVSNGDGTHTRSCECGKQETVSCSGGTATCKEAAICDFCKASYGEPDSSAHNWDLTSNGNNWHNGSCTICSKGGGGPCYGGTATCNAQAICDLCKAPYGEKKTHSVSVSESSATSKTVACPNCDFESTVTWLFNESEVTYTGDPIGAGTVTYSDNWVGEKYQPTVTDNVKVGTATAEIPLLEGTWTKTFKIVPRDISEATVTLSSATGTYTGKELTPPTVTVTYNGKTLVEGTDYTVEWDGELIEPNFYNVEIAGKGNFTNACVTTYEIMPAELLDFSFTEIKTALVYTGVPQAPEVSITARTVDGSPVTITFSRETGGYTSEMPTVNHVGTAAYYYQVDAENHICISGRFYVSMKKGTNEWVNGPAVTDGTYGQIPVAHTAEAKFGDYTVTYTGKTNAGADYASADAPTEAGDYKAIFTVEETMNYNGLTAEIAFSVQRKALTREDVTYTEPTDLVYNGKSRHNDLGVSIVGEEREWTLTFFNADTDEQQIPRDAGDYYFTVTAVEDSNYQFCLDLKDPDFKFTIHKADPTISWDATVFTYDGAEHGEAKVTLVNGETYTGRINYTCTKGSDTSGNLPVDAGTYKLTASIDGQKNYNAAAKETTITINPMTITPTVTLSSDAIAYDGRPHHPVVKVEFDGKVLPKSGNYATSFVNATEVGVATATITSLDGSNYTFTPVEIDYLILPNVCPESGPTPENVTSEYLDLINEIQEQMDGVDISTTSQNAQDKWNEIAEYLKSLEDAIKQILEQMQEIIDETAALPEHPTGDDLDKINDLLDTYEDIKDQLTDAEKEDLADEIEKLETEKGHIEETNKTFDDVVADAEEILDKDLTSKDKEAVEDMLDRVNDLLEDPHLTDEQKETLEDLKDQLEDVMDAFDAAAKVEEMIDELPKTGEPDDKDLRDEYKEAKEAYEELGENKGKVDPKYVTKLEKLAKALRDYKIIKGNAQRWYTNAEEVVNLYFTANGPYSKFDYIKIDGEILDEKHYTSREGSTIVGLKASYLETLSYAKHTIAIGYVDGELSGEATGYFRVTLHTDSPLTGDTTNIIAIGALCLVSLAALVGLTVYRKKRGSKAE